MNEVGCAEAIPIGPAEVPEMTELVAPIRRVGPSVGWGILPACPRTPQPPT